MRGCTILIFVSLVLVFYFCFCLYFKSANAYQLASIPAMIMYQMMGDDDDDDRHLNLDRGCYWKKDAFKRKSKIYNDIYDDSDLSFRVFQPFYFFYMLDLHLRWAHLLSFGRQMWRKKMKTPKAEQFFFFFCSPLNKYYVIPLDIIHLWSNRYFLLFVWRRRRLLLGNHICIFLSTPSGIVFFLFGLWPQSEWPPR